MTFPTEGKGENGMKCDRLISLVKSWYLKVQEEAMAPARMVAFMEKHISQCEECLADPEVKQEAEKIREIVLPPSKVPKPKVVRVPKEATEGNEETDETHKEADDTADEADDISADVDAAEDGENDGENDDEDEDYDPDLLDDDDEI
jgi:hypothetical protein